MTNRKIIRLGHLGEGICDGPIYAGRTLSDEIVSGTVEGDQLLDVKIVTPSADRIAPKCPAYNRCGACALHHASDAFVGDWKVGVVKHALTARGLDVSFRQLHTSPIQSRRRAKLSGKRTKKALTLGLWDGMGKRFRTLTAVRF